MRKVLLIVLSILFVSSLNFAELKLKLPAELTGETKQSIINKNLETNLKLNLPAEVAPADMRNFVKGMMMVGILADATFPFGEDFKHVAGTGFSGHAMFGYVVAQSFLLTLRAGYVKYSGQTTEDEFGSYEDDFSEIPILLGAYYLFGGGNAFHPYIGIALGLYLQTYSFTWHYTAFGQDITEEGDESESKFGVAPGAGFYYFLAATTMLQMAVEYNIIFADYLGDSSNITSLAILLGVSFALGSN
jgi:opacity protein-like surface antigen